MLCFQNSNCDAQDLDNLTFFKIFNTKDEHQSSIEVGMNKMSIQPIHNTIPFITDNPPRPQNLDIGATLGMYKYLQRHT